MNVVTKGTVTALEPTPPGDRVDVEQIEPELTTRQGRETGGANPPEVAPRTAGATSEAPRGSNECPIPREEYELGITWLAERSGFSREKVRRMIDIVPADWPRLDAAISALSDYLEASHPSR
jgi:hypothetical protein